MIEESNAEEEPNPAAKEEEEIAKNEVKQPEEAAPPTLAVPEEPTAVVVEVQQKIEEEAIDATQMEQSQKLLSQTGPVENGDTVKQPSQPVPVASQPAANAEANAQE